MRNLTIDKIAIIVLSLATIALVGLGLVIAYPRLGPQKIIVAAGTPSGESYLLMQAVKAVAERHYPRLAITLLETSGTVDSWNRIEAREAQMATGESDVMAGASARSVARLFPDVIQVLVHNDAKIQRFADLKGKRIALVRTQGPFKTFLLLARHFGLAEGDFNFVGSDDESAELAFARHQADAFFMVRVLGSGAAPRLVRAGDVGVMPIEDAVALHQDVPSFQAFTIPKDSYLAVPSVPAVDTQTVSLDRILLARSDVPDDVIFEITETLIDRRQEIAGAISEANTVVRPLPAQIRPPDPENTLIPGVHQGAALYYSHGRIKASEGEMFAATVTVGVFLGLWLLAIRTTVRHRQKEYSGRFNRKVLQLLAESRSSSSDRQLGAIRVELLKLMERAVLDLDRNRMSEQSFLTSLAVWQIAFDLLRERFSSAGIDSGAIRSAGNSQESEKPHRWSLLRDP